MPTPRAKRTHNRLTHNVTVRLTAEEFRRWREAAERSRHRGLSSFVREVMGRAVDQQAGPGGG